MIDTCRRFIRDERGATAIEYALILILCSTAMIAALYATRQSLNDNMGSISAQLQSAVN